MATVVKILYEQLVYVHEISNRDSRVAHFPLLGPPWSMLAMIALYLLFVCRIGPAWMAKRQPFDVKIPMQIYNLSQIIVNVYVMIAMTRFMMQSYFKISCQNLELTDVRPGVMALRIPAYLYYVSRYMDFMDTIFFVLRKKNNQITFLHVYHHAVMVFGVWIYMTLLFGSHYAFGGYLNSIVHIGMYTYYFLAALKLKIDLNPWKRRLTQLQIVQFSVITLQLIPPIFNNWCKLNMFWHLVATFQNAFLLVLFTEFYYKAYVRPDMRKAKNRSRSSGPNAESNNSLLLNASVDSKDL